jgi:hypothetical protein
MILFWAIGFAVLAGFVPPPGPRTDAHQWTELIRDNTTGIRFGLILTVLGSALLAPFVGVISMHMKRIEGRDSPLTYAQLVLGACLILEFVLPMTTIQAATYRPERAPDIILALTDLSWVWFFGIASTIVLQAIVLGIVILQDSRSVPRFPRWSGYVSIWAGLLFSPGSFLIFFKDGPMAWNGLLVFWTPIAAFAIWIAVIVTLMIQVSGRPEPDGGADDSTGLSRRVADLSSELADVRNQLARLSA